METIKAFYSYSHKDELFREQLETHLSLLKRKGFLEGWHFRKILPGQDGNKAIDERLSAADLILLLVSSDFVASDYCWNVELDKALNMHELGHAHVVPIIVRPCDWRDAPFAKLWALPTDAKPITTWSNVDEAWLDVASGIKEAITVINSKKKRSNQKHAFTNIQDFLSKDIDLIDAQYRSGSTVSGLATGLSELDEKLSGLQSSELVVIAARPAMGKTALGLNIVVDVAVGQKKPVAIFSMEMPGHLITRRMAVSLGRIDAHTLRSGRLPDDDWPKLTSAVSLLAEAPVYIDDTPNLSIGEVFEKTRRIKQENSLSLIVIDYLQLLEEGASDHAIKSLKSLAKELDISVILLSQLGRQLEKRADKRPVISDLPNSEAIEQYVDVVLFIYRDEIYNEESIERGVAEIIISRQKNGPPGVVKATFLSPYLKFEDYVSRRPSAIPQV